MNINTRYLKFGKLEYPEDVPVDGYIQIRIVGDDTVHHFQCVKEEKKSNQDGTYDVTYVLKYDPR